jgi:hypothetical protein
MSYAGRRKPPRPHTPLKPNAGAKAGASIVSAARKQSRAGDLREVDTSGAGVDELSPRALLSCGQSHPIPLWDTV